jgi:hypothetical protein
VTEPYVRKLTAFLRGVSVRRQPIEFWPRRVDPAQPRGGSPLCPHGVSLFYAARPALLGDFPVGLAFSLSNARLSLNFSMPSCG